MATWYFRPSLLRVWVHAQSSPNFTLLYLRATQSNRVWSPVPSPLPGKTFFIFFYFLLFLHWAGPRPHKGPHPISSRPHFVCKFSRHGSSSPVTSHVAPSITVSVFPYSADAYSRTTASYRLTQLFRPNTRE